jgi:hypothetical protein
MPEHVHRGKRFIDADGTMHDARLERESEDLKKLGPWRWRGGPFDGTREWNGLRVLMALINNWDLKDENNSVYEVRVKAAKKEEPPDLLYVVSDLGATFGPVRFDSGRKTDKGDLSTFRRSSFIRRVHEDTVDFTVPGEPSPILLFNPREYFRRRRLTWIGKDIPREDARWMGSLLAGLSPSQIQDAFRAGGYSPKEVEAFAAIVERRISDLSKL